MGLRLVQSLACAIALSAGLSACGSSHSNAPAPNFGGAQNPTPNQRNVSGGSVDTTVPGQTVPVQSAGAVGSCQIKNLACVEVANGTVETTVALSQSCGPNGGVFHNVACSARNVVATCTTEENGAILKMRFYNVTMDQAQQACTDGTLTAGY